MDFNNIYDTLYERTLKTYSLSRTDLALTRDLDLAIEDGDLKVRDGIDNFDQRLALILKTFPNTWKIYPSFGFPIHIFIGQVLTDGLIATIKDKLTEQLNSFYSTMDATFSVNCIAEDKITIKITIEIIDTSGNTLHTKIINFRFSNAESTLGGSWSEQSGSGFVYYIPDSELNEDEMIPYYFVQYDQATGKSITGYPPGFGPDIYPPTEPFKPGPVKVITEFGSVVVSPNVVVSYMLDENPDLYIE